jgi:hypothetical protein
VKLSKEQYERYALELENDQSFYKWYTHLPTCDERRSWIRSSIIAKLGHYYGADIEDGEQLRRYFDDLWGITSDPEGQRKYDTLIDIWDDDEPVKPVKSKKAAPSSTKEEPIMNSPTPIEITTKTFVNGNDVSTMTDGQIYALIAGEEQRIRELRAIGNQPKRLVAEIAKREAGIQALVTYLDSKE